MKRTVDPYLEDLRELVLRMGSLAEAILAKSLRAVWERSADLAQQVREDDLEIDRLDLSIDAEATQVLALQQPVANDLRGVLAIRTMAGDLERVGDLARNVAKSAERLAALPAVAIPPRLEDLADQAQRALRGSLDAFSDANTERARHVLDDDDTVDETESRFVQEAIEQAGAHPDTTAQQVDLILIAKSLERVADHATNIAEDVIFLTEARLVRHESKLNGSATG